MTAWNVPDIIYGTDVSVELEVMTHPAEDGLLCVRIRAYNENLDALLGLAEARALAEKLLLYASTGKLEKP